MVPKKVFVTAMLLAILIVMLFGTALAEDKWVNNIYGITFHVQGGYKAYTYSTALAPYLEVYMKSWGSCCPRYKGGAVDGHPNIYRTADVVLADIYWTYTTRHTANTQYGGIEFYTSDNGTHSTFCWWNKGKAAC